jgi:tyrosine-protein kinase Etk/Wzc
MMDTNPLINQEDEKLEIRKYLGIFISNWYWFIIALFLAISIVYLINTYSEPTYSVASSLLIKDDKEGTNFNSTENIFPGGDMFRSQQTLQNEIGILKSFSLNLRVINELRDFHVVYVSIGRRGVAERRLFNQAPFSIKYDSLGKQPKNVVLKIQILDRERIQIQISSDKDHIYPLKFGERFSISGFDFYVILKDTANFKLDQRSSNKFKAWFESPDNLANNYRNGLGIQPINKDATLVTLNVSGFVPQQEAQYLNKLMELYIKQGLEYKYLTGDSTISFINRQLKIIADSLTIAEINLQNFKDSSKMINLSAEGAAIQNRLEKFESEKTNLRLQQYYYKYLENYIGSKNESGAIVSPSLMGVSDPLLIKLVNDLSTLQLQKKQLLFNYSNSMPAVSLINSKIDDARESLIENIKSSSESSERAMEDVNARINDVNREVRRMPLTERGLIKYQRSFDINNTVYTYLLEKKSEAGIARASRISGNRIIDYAMPSGAVAISPQKNRNILIAIILGILVPAIFIFLADFLNDKIIDKKDIVKGTTVPVIGFVGHSDLKNEIPVFLKPGSALSESFRSIRTSLKYFLDVNKTQVISITSTISGEGKTFVAVNLAAIFAMLNKKTLVVGLDLRKPRMQRIFNSHDSLGLSNYLISECELEEIIKGTDIPNLYYINSGPIPPNPAELIESVRMKEFILRTKEIFDFIILDTPPVGIVSDALLLTVYSDINLFIVRQRYSSKSTLEFIQNIFESKELKNPAIIINDIIVSGYYGYGIRYGGGLYAGYGYDYGYGRYGRYNYGETSNYYVSD